jgi:hypothetical protein
MSGRRQIVTVAFAFEWDANRLATLCANHDHWRLMRRQGGGMDGSRNRMVQLALDLDLGGRMHVIHGAGR